MGRYEAQWVAKILESRDRFANRPPASGHEAYINDVCDQLEAAAEIIRQWGGWLERISHANDRYTAEQFALKALALTRNEQEAG